MGTLRVRFKKKHECRKYPTPTPSYPWNIVLHFWVAVYEDPAKTDSAAHVPETSQFRTNLYYNDATAPVWSNGTTDTSEVGRTRI